MKTNNRGQATIEVAAFFLVLSVLLAGLCSFTKWILIREKVLLAAKEGALLYSSGHFQPDEVKTRILDFMTHGSPALDPQRIQIPVLGRKSGLNAWYMELDQVTVRYTHPGGGWPLLLNINPTVEETCIVKHAPHYEAPLQTLWGPAVPY